MVMGGRREHVPTRLRLSRDTLALIDVTVEKAREEFDDPEIDRHLVEQKVFRHVVQRNYSSNTVWKT